MNKYCLIVHIKKILIAPALVALVACGNSELNTSLEKTATPGTAVISDYAISVNEISITWSKTEGADAEQWRAYRNSLRVCDASLIVSDTNNEQSGQCSFSLVDGFNTIYVQLCNFSGGSETLCTTSASLELDHEIIDSGDSAPGPIYLDQLPDETIDEQLYVKWVKDEGANGDLWYIYHNSLSVCSGDLPLATDEEAQSAGCNVDLGIGDHQLQARLCVNKPVGIADLCTDSEIHSLTVAPDPGRIIATPVIEALDASLPAWETTINWSKDTQDGSAGESWIFYHNTEIACTGTLAANETASSCTLELQEGNNSMYVQLCTEVETYSGADCSESEISVVEGVYPYALTPGEIRISTVFTSQTYDQSVDVDWTISSGDGVSEWYLLLNDSQHCLTTSADYTTSGSCLIDLNLGDNNISIFGCNYGFDGTSSCTQSDISSTERLQLPGTPQITSPTETSTYSAEQTLSWERSSGASAERWVGSVNGEDLCSGDLLAADEQSGQCAISLTSGHNELQVRLCISDSIGSSYCVDSDLTDIELLAPIPGLPVISTASQVLLDDEITIDWSKSSGADGSSWYLTNNALEVSGCGPEVQTSDGTQSGSCLVGLTQGDNVIAVTLCASNTAGSQSCSTSVTVVIDRQLDSPTFTSNNSISIAENSTGIIYTPAVQDNDSSAEQISFALLETDDHAAFSLDPASGAITASIELDYDNPQDADQNNIYQLQLEVYDETGSGDSMTLQIAITNLNDNSPSFASSSSAVLVPENTIAVFYDANATDLDGDTVAYSLAGIDSNYFNLDSTSGELSFKDVPDFEDPQDQDQDNTYELELSASDANYTTSLELNISVSDSNDETPQVPSPTASTAHDISEITLESVIYTVEASDADADDILTYTLGGVDADQFNLDNTNGELRFTTLPSLSEPQDDDGDNTYHLEISVNDSAANSTSLALVVTVANGIGSAPEFSIESASVDFPENSSALAYDANATDADGDTITYTLGGADIDLFTIDDTNGEVGFKAAPDYEVPLGTNGNNYTLIIFAVDSVGNQSELDLDVIVTNLNDNEPSFAHAPPGTISVSENTDTNAIIYDANATDTDGDTLVYGLGGADQDYFDLNSENGQLSFKQSPDFEAPFGSNTDNIYGVEISSADADTAVTLTLSIAVTDLNEAHYFETSSSSLSLSENDSSGLALPAVVDPDLSNAITYELIAIAEGNNDYQYFNLTQSENSTEPSISFADPAGADYENISDHNGDYTYEFILQASDADYSASHEVNVTITNLNDNQPGFTNTNPDSISVPEATATSTIIYTVTATDLDGDTLAYTLGGTDSTHFDLNSANGQLSFKQVPDFEDPQDQNQDNTYDLEISTADADTTITLTLSITVSNLNEAHYFATASTSLSLSENDSSSLTLPAVIDPDLSNNIVYELIAIASGNNDYQSFNLSQSQDSAPSIAFADSQGADYENITDHNSDHTYEFILQASDADYSASHEVNVTITNLNDNLPTFTDSSPLSLTFPENTSASTTIYTATATDGDADPITYSLGGADSAHFNLDSASGELKFKQAPDFENPFGSNPDNTYDLEISASDGEASATLELSIEVTDVEDTAPNAPTNLSALAADSSVVLSWDSLESISNYTIYQSTSPDLSTSDFEETYTNIATSPETISGLSNGTTYYFLITASNSVGTSSPSAVVSATPQAYALACPYPSATASKADTSALDCACTGSSANAMLALASEVTFSCADSQRNIVGNSVPDHAPGVFPNDGNPNAIAAVTGNYSHSLQPTWLDTEDTSEQVPGVARNGVKLEPETGETYQGDNAWRYEAIQDALDLGLDEHHAHVQPTGMYHYHGMPKGHLDLIGISNAMILVGWARDGHPIYARYGYSDPLDSTSAIKVVSGSYEHRDLGELNELGRPSSDSERGLDSLPLGVFVADWEYVNGSGDLDECNGRYGVTPQFPDGIYHYYITDDYPYIQRCLKGNEPPAFTSANSVSVAENTRPDSVIYTASAIDNGGDSFTFALNYTAHDGALFSIDPDSGELRFLTSPNYEFPHDGDGDNRYTVVIEADDGLAGGIAPLELEVTVTNDTGETSPYFAGDSVGSVTEDPETEGQEIAVLALEVEVYDDDDDPAGRALSLELEGEDGSLFAIASTDSANSYQVNFITSPDFDFAHDANGDSTYSFTVVVTDSDANEVRHSATIVVDGINDEAPYINPEVYDGSSIYFPENNTSVIINLTGAGYDPDRTSWSDPNPYQPNQDSITFALTTHMSQSDSDLFYLDPDTLELSPKEPFDHENPKQLNSTDNSYWVEVALSDQAGNKNTVDGSEEGAGDRIVRVTISDIVDESTQPVESGPQIPWFNSSDLAAGADVAIPWVIYAGQGAINWDMYVNGNTECSYVVSDINSPVSSGTCVVSASKFTTGTTDNSAAVSVCDIDGNCATSESVIFGYAVSSTDGYYPSYPSNSGDASDCADVEVGEPVNSVNNSSCYNYLLSDDAFGGPYDEIPAYLKADSGRNFDVIAYFIEWGVYARDFDTHDLPANLLSTALFSFIKFDGDRAIRTSNTEATDAERECEDCTFTGEVAIADTWAVFDKPYYKPGEEEKYEDEAENAEDLANILLDKGVSTGKGIFQQLWLLKQKFPHLKTCVSVGGWSFSRPFPLLRTQEGMLETFVDSIVDLAQQYHFDCIDIDWEFPGKAGGDYVNNDAEIVYDLNGNGISPFTNPTDEDADTFNELIAALRAEIDQRGAAIEINSAVYTSTDGMAIMDYSNFPVNLEGIHMMTYDYYGAWDPFTGMQAALYASTDPVDDQVILEQGFNPYNPDHNIASAMTRGVNNAMAHGFQSNVQIRQKIVPGLAFYGRNYSGVGASHGGQDPSSKRFMVSAYKDGNGETAQFGWEAGNLNYVQIKGYYNHGDTVYGNADYIAVDDDGNEYTTGGKHWTYQWSQEAQTPFLFDDNRSIPYGSFVSYTDPRGIYYQTCHAAWQNSKGVMFWEISGDSKDFHLVNAIHAAVRGDDLVHDNYTNNPSCTDLDQIDHGDIVYGEAAGGGDGDGDGGDGDGDGGDGDGGDGDNGGDSGEGLAGLVELGYIDSSTFNSMFPHRNNDPSSTAQGVDTYTWDGFSKAAAEFTAAGFLNVGSTDDRLRELAAFLANTSHETGNSTGSYALSNIGGGIGNTRYDAGYYFQQEQYCAAGGSGYGYTACDYCELGFGYDYACDWLYADGNKFDYYYYGRGPLQLSYNYNYGPFSEYYYNGDADVLLYDANKMLEDSEVAFASALWFWMTVQSPKPSMHQVMVGTYEPSLEDQSLGRYPGFGMSINVLNGGVECGATPSAGTAAYDKIRNRLGYYLTYLNLFSAKQNNVGISPWVGEYALSTPATSLDFPTDDESLLVTYPDANKYLGCSEMYNYQ